MYILSNFHHICTQAKKVSDRNQEISKMEDSMLVDNGACFLFEQEGNAVVSLRRSAALTSN